MKISVYASLILFSLSFLSCHDIKYPGELIPDSNPYDKEVGKEYLEVLAYGDAGKGSDDQQSTADSMGVYMADPINEIDKTEDFIMNLGDSFYEGGVTSITDL